MKRILLLTTLVSLLASTTIARDPVYKKVYQVSGGNNDTKLIIPSWPGGGGFSPKLIFIRSQNITLDATRTSTLTIYLKNGSLKTTQATATDSVAVSLKERGRADLGSPAGLTEFYYSGPFSDEMRFAAGTNTYWSVIVWGN